MNRNREITRRRLLQQGLVAGIGLPLFVSCLIGGILIPGIESKGIIGGMASRLTPVWIALAPAAALLSTCSLQPGGLPPSLRHQATWSSSRAAPLPSTTACSGGSRYRAVTSCTFSMNRGSVLSLKVAERCGCRPKARQIRLMVARFRLYPYSSSAAANRDIPCE